METIVLVVHMLICVVLVGAVLMQRSEGGALGLGGGGSGGLISGRGAADLMVRVTSGVAGVFFLTSIALTVMANLDKGPRSVLETAASSSSKSRSAPSAAVAPFQEEAATTGAEDPSNVAPAPVEAPARAGPVMEPSPTARPVVGAAPPASGAAKAAAGSAPAAAKAGSPRPPSAVVGAQPPAGVVGATPPAPSAESGQPAVPSPDSRPRVGPDQ